MITPVTVSVLQLTATSVALAHDDHSSGRNATPQGTSGLKIRVR
jgi:hypothetical protein